MRSRVRPIVRPALRWPAVALLGVCAGAVAAHPQPSVDQTLAETSTLSAPLTPRAHEHGLADLAIAQDGNQWWLELRLPLADLVGFERLPRNNTEAAAVLAAVRALATESLLLDPECATEAVEARLEPGGVIDLQRGQVPQATPASALHDHKHDHDRKHHDEHGDHEHGNQEHGHDDAPSGASGHVDLYLTRTHLCPSPGPSGLQLRWPTEAGTQPRVRAQWLLEYGQGSTQVQATDAQVRWRRDD